MPAPKHCCVPFCNSNRETKVSFHEFPSDIARRNAWLIAIARDNFRPSEYSKVCGYHFQESDFVRLKTRTILKKKAVPTIFEGYPTFRTDENNSDLNRNQIADKGYANKIRLLKEANCSSFQIQALLTSEKIKRCGTQTKMNASGVSCEVTSLNHSYDGATVASVPDTEEFESERQQTQITGNTIPLNHLDEAKCSKNEVTYEVGSQHNLDSPHIVRPKRPITHSGLPHKKFNSLHLVHFNRRSPLKKDVTPTIIKAYPSFAIKKNNQDHLKGKANIRNCFANRMMKISPLSKNEAAKLFDLSSCSSKEAQSVSDIENKTKMNFGNVSHHLGSLNCSKHNGAALSVQNSKAFESGNTPTQTKVIVIPSNKRVEKKFSSKNQVETQLNLSKFCSIRPKQQIMPSGSVKNNIKNVYILNVNAPTSPKKETIIRECPRIIENNSDLLKRKADISNCVVNKSLKISSLSKNEDANVFRQSTCLSNEVPDTERIENELNASNVPYQLISSLNCSSDYEIVSSVPDAEEFAGQNVQSKINISTIPSNNFSEVKYFPNNVLIQAGTQLNFGSIRPIAAKGSKSQTGRPKNYAKSNNSNLNNVAVLRRKIRSMSSQMCQKNKQIKSLKIKLEEMSEELEYFKNNALLQNVEKMQVINNEGLATKQIQFILNQISNLDKKAPRWSKEVIRECVLLHASFPKAYEALQKGELFKLPNRSTLMRFAPSANSQTRNDSNWDSEPELTTEIANYEPEFEVANETVSSGSSGDMEEDMYFNTSISDMF